MLLTCPQLLSAQKTEMLVAGISVCHCLVSVLAASQDGIAAHFTRWYCSTLHKMVLQHTSQDGIAAHFTR